MSLEGWRSKAYLDGGGVPTIGWGRTLNVKLGMTTTKAIETQWIEGYVAYLEGQIQQLVRVPLTPNQHDALVIFIFNIGVRAFSESTLLQHLNNRRFDLIPAQFRRWVFDNGKVVRGLLIRRERTIELWLAA